MRRLLIRAKNNKLFPVAGRIDATAAATCPSCVGGSEGAGVLDGIGSIGFGVGGKSSFGCGSAGSVEGSVSGSTGSSNLDLQQSSSTQL